MTTMTAITDTVPRLAPSASLAAPRYPFVDPMIPRMNARQLIMLVDQAADALSVAEGPDAARRMLTIAAARMVRAVPTMRDIAMLTAAEHGLTLDELRSKSRCRRVARPRQEAFYRIYATGRYSQTQIGGYFGGRDHTTVLHGRLQYAKRLAEAAVGE